MNSPFIKPLIALGKEIHNLLIQNSNNSSFQKVIENAESQNAWFTKEFIHSALLGVCKFLDETALLKFVHEYCPEPASNPKTVYIIMAGNIPLVGFQDFLHVLLSGHNVLIKLSRNDSVILPYLIFLLSEHRPELHQKVQFTTLKTPVCDAVIATGSNNSARYFEYYFRNIPHIIRKTRTSCAILTGNETEQELSKLADDIFQYFGLGCRNVSFLLIPEGYPINKFFIHLQKYSYLSGHLKYQDNYKLQKSLFILNQEQFIDAGNLLLKQSVSVYSPVSVLHYTFYSNLSAVKDILRQYREEIQCIVTSEKSFPFGIPFGKSQEPEPDDFADGKNTMDFLKEI